MWDGACFAWLHLPRVVLFCFVVTDTCQQRDQKCFSKFVCQGMEAHVLHGMNLFHVCNVWKFSGELELSVDWSLKDETHSVKESSEVLELL